MGRRWRGVAGALMAGVALGGCGLDLRLPTSPAAGAHASTATTAAAAATGAAGAAETRTPSAPRVRNHELPTPPGPEERAPAASSAPAALEHFAGVYINWDANDVKRRLLELADQCVGQARTALALEAAQTGADPELRQAGIANRGTVEAVAPLRGSGRRYVVITRETTSAADSSAYQGLAPAWHLTVATVARRGAGWVISGWQPES